MRHRPNAMHKDESARDTTLFRHFLTKMTSSAKISPRFNGRTRLSFRKQLKDSFTFTAHCLAPTDSSLNKQKNATYSSQSFSYTSILSLFMHFVNRFSQFFCNRAWRVLNFQKNKEHSKECSLDLAFFSEICKSQ